jgi:hypothetical protein
MSSRGQILVWLPSLDKLKHTSLLAFRIFEPGSGPASTCHLVPSGHLRDGTTTSYQMPPCSPFTINLKYLNAHCLASEANNSVFFFLDVMPCSLVKTERRVTCVYFLHQGDDGGSRHLWNVSQFLPDYETQYPRRQSYSWPWEHKISPSVVSKRTTNQQTEITASKLFGWTAATLNQHHAADHFEKLIAEDPTSVIDSSVWHWRKSNLSSYFIN